MKFDFEPTTHLDHVIEKLDADAEEEQTLGVCCRHTIEDGIALNSLLFCPECRNKIKGYSTKAAFKNYVDYCRTRRRNISCHKVDDRYIVTYRDT